MFGVLFIAFNPYTKDVYVLDEIYEKDQLNTSVNVIGPEILEKQHQFLIKQEWTNIYDEAATWFQTEMTDRFDVFFIPTQKSQNKKEHGLSLMKDIMLEGLLHVSDRCRYFYWECENYIKDKNGKIPKINDHLIDCFRYFLGASCYELNEKEEYIMPKRVKAFDSMIKGYRGDIEDEVNDWGNVEADEFKIQEEW